MTILLIVGEKNDTFRKIKIIIMEFLTDLWLFMRERKKYWLLPIIIVLLLIGILVAFAGSTAVAPFVYTLF
jgi:hypothetical protein